MKTLITITANIAAGKSSLLEELEKHIDRNKVVILREPLDKWQNKIMENGLSIFANFCQDQKTWAFEFEKFVFESRMEQIKTAIDENPNASVFVLERSPDDDRFIFVSLFSQLNWISNEQLEQMDELRKEWVETYEPMVKHIVYLDTSPYTCWERKQSRAREGEDTLGLDYFTQLDYLTLVWVAKKRKAEESLIHLFNDCFHNCPDHTFCPQFGKNVEKVCELLKQCC